MSAFIFKDIFKLILLLVIDGILINLCRKYYILICNEHYIIYHYSLLIIIYNITIENFFLLETKSDLYDLMYLLNYILVYLQNYL